MRFNINGSEALRIDNSGRLLAGTTSTRTNIAGQTLDHVFEEVDGTLRFGLVSGTTNTSSPILALCKHRGTTAGSLTAVNSGDNTGVVMFTGSDGTNFLRSAQITSVVDGTPGTNDMPGRLEFLTTADGASSPTERMRIKSNGQVEFKNGSFGDNVDCVMANSGTMEIGAQTEIKFRTGTNERMRVTDNGLTFNGDTAAANALDDYEEGTWTPAFISGITSVGHSHQEGSYTKIGDLVTFTLEIKANSGTENSDHLRIGGLPFTSSSSRDEGGAFFSYRSSLAGGSENIYLQIPKNVTQIRFYNDSGTDWDGNNGNGIKNKHIHIQGQYFA